MDLQQLDWTKQLKDTPFTQRRFTEQHRARTMERIHAKRRQWPRYRLAAIVSIAIVTAAIYQVLGGEESGPTPVQPNGEQDLRQSTPAGTDYVNAGTKQMKVYYDDTDGYFDDPFSDIRGPYVSDKPFGYRYHLAVPVDELQNRTFSAYATHVHTGQRVTAVTPITIQEKKYMGKDAFAASFALPLHGEWEIEAQLEGALYDTVVVEAGELSWERSTTFLADGQSLRGDEGDVGFTDGRFIAGKEGTYRWYFWGDEELDGEFTLRAVRRGSDRMIDLFAADSLGGPMDGADRQIEMTFALPESGDWRLLPFLDGRLINSLVIEVTETESDAVRRSVDALKRKMDDIVK